MTDPLPSSTIQRLFHRGKRVLHSYDGEWVISLLTLPETPVMRAFRYGVMMVMPLLLAAAIAILINNFPLQIYQNFMASVFGTGWKEPGVLVFNSTIQILALAIMYSLSGCLIELHNQQRPTEAVAVPIGVITCFSCMFIMMNPEMGPNGMVLEWVGIRGLFGTFILTFCASKLFLYLCRIKLLRIPFYSEGADPILPQIFDTLMPALCTMGVFIAAREIFSYFGIDSLHQAFYDALRAPFHDAQSSFGLGALYTLLVQVCWFFGIHGPDLLDPITHNIFLQGMQANSLAANSGQVPPQILNKYLFDVYVYMGGSGATLGLLLAIFFRSNDNGTRRIAFLSTIPGIFNINELVIFGLPIVLNPAFLIPFVCVPLILLTISYFAVLFGLAPQPVFQVDWTTPPIINALISTGSWRGAFLQVVNLTVATLVYMPFVELADRSKITARRKAFDDLVAIALSNTRGANGKRCIDRLGSAGALARSLANDLQLALDRNDGVIALHFQPRINFVEKSVPCVESLLRWQHPVLGSIPAVLALAIAEDADLTIRLDNHILQCAFEQQYKWRNDGVFTTVSVNLSESQLRDKNFPALLDSLYARNNLPADSILLEVQEALALDPEARYLPALQAIHATGANIAVDDFGKGYQAISHIKRLPLSELQIDRALIRDIATNKSCQDVIGTIQELCIKLGIKTSAEFIESEDQLETLLELNFSNFQGHLFSQPLPADECRDFIRTFSGKLPS